MPKIMVVDNEPAICNILTRRLERRGYEVVSAGDGAAACTLVPVERPDLILMDLTMPVLDGWEATRRLKADDATRAIPIIALTARATTGEREKALQAGCDEYEAKPINLDRLLDKMQALLTRTEV